MANKLLITLFLILSFRKFWRVIVQLKKQKEFLRQISKMSVLNLSDIYNKLKQVNGNKIVCFIQGFIETKNPIKGFYDKVNKFIYYAISKSFRHSNNLNQVKNGLDFTNQKLITQAYSTKNLIIKDIHQDMFAPINLSRTTYISDAISEISANSFNLTIGFFGKIYVIIARLMKYIFPFGSLIKGTNVQQIWTELGIKNNSFVTVLAECGLNKKNELVIETKQILKQKSSYIQRLKNNINKKEQSIILFICIGGVILFTYLKSLIKYLFQNIKKLLQSGSKQPLKQQQDHSCHMQNNTFYCFICYTNYRSIIFKPCKHFGVCKQCYKILTTDDCPVCKLHIDGIIEIEKIDQFIQ